MITIIFLFLFLFIKVCFLNFYVLLNHHINNVNIIHAFYKTTVIASREN
jgi:hypothetical protein